MQIRIDDYILELLPEKAVLIPHRNTLALADVHLGKAHHFRKEGLPIPVSAQENDYLRLSALFLKYRPDMVLFLGDLFHSTFNKDWDTFSALIRKWPDIRFVLLRGNHDIIDTKLFELLGIEVLDMLQLEVFLFTHKPSAQVATGMVNLCGHLHPGVILSGNARQRLRLPCFYWKGEHLILPAFGNLTGLAIMERQKGDKAFGIVANEVCRLF